ncbi:MAG: GNAT family N-acetyltransferase [Leptolyngbyaceae bacterium]|nr:GNAT family N-acetyltransferase [Leptolyngbyaceae bacterium]
MTQLLPQNANTTIRGIQYHDLDAVEQLFVSATAVEGESASEEVGKYLQQIRRWYGPVKFLSLFPNPLQDLFCSYVAEQDNQVRGAIQVSPFNRTRTTWRVDQVAVETAARNQGVGSQLLRHCFEAIWEARTWLLEVNVNNQVALAIYRQTGFQSLAQMTYWAIAPEILHELAEREPDLPNLLPTSNADAQLLYQLDTAAMPPLVRQVFDRHINDFKTNLFGGLIRGVQCWMHHQEIVSGYVFEPQRKAAIGYFQVQVCRDGSKPHEAQLTVHPAYTWLYPELLCQMARVVQKFPAQSLQLASADYQPEREEFLERLGASRMAHTLMMSRSVWHKLRESRHVSLESLQLAEMLQSFQPAQKPIPSRISLLQSLRDRAQADTKQLLDAKNEAFRSEDPNEHSLPFNADGL